MHHRTRTLQFGSYSFAGSLAEILLSLTHGGCVCIPTDEERTSNLASAISRMGITWAFLTSTVLDLLSPKAVPSLITLCVGGEPIRISQIVQWEAWVYLRQTYGSSETSGFVSSRRLNSMSSTRDVGRASTGIYWIVDPNDHSKLAPIGAIGEVLIEGAILGREYIDEPEKTAATFIKAPAWRRSFAENLSQPHLYKTGDLARYKQDGSIELLGRKDNQVKLRGQRIELGEIEHQAQLASTYAKQIAVELIRPKGEDGMLACFIVVDDSKNPPAHDDEERATRRTHTQDIIQAIQARLEQWLPQYMVPSVFIPVANLPATSSRKIDRKRLREIGASFSSQQLAEMRLFSQGPKRLPSTQTEQMVQQLWGQALQIEPQSISLDDSFFRLGGDSIMAMKLVGEARRIGMHLSVADIFRHPQLDQLASAVIVSTHNSLTAIPHVDHVGPVKQSFAQGRLWFLEELHPGLTWYLMPLAVRFKGPLNLVALNAAFHAIESRHETLRTTFATDRGVSVQIVQPFRAKELNIINILPDNEQGLIDAVQQDQTTPFDLRTEPGWRVSVYRVNEHDHALSIVMHHIVSDGWSVDVLMRELAAFYSAALRSQDPLSQVQPLPIQYRDFSVWQRKQVQVDEHQRQLSHWLTQLKGSRPAELLCDKPRPATLSGKADSRTLEISGRLYAELQDFCNAHEVTLFVALLAAFRATHFRLTGQDDATIGTANANRDWWEVKDIIGFFVNMQCLRITINDESFEELVQQVHGVAVASLANQDVPFETIVSQLKQDRDLSRHPLVQLVFAVHSQQNLGQLVLEGVETEGIHGAATSRFDLEFHFYPQTNGLQGNVVFSTDLYAPETIENMLSLFHNVLEGCLKDPKAVVASLPLLTNNNFAKLEAMRLVQVEQTNYPRESSVVDLFRQQASTHPSRVAVIDASAEMGYAELDRASDLLARWLVRRSIPPESLVGVLASRSCQAIVALLGILKANLAYLPFDVKIPGKRMEAILSSLSSQTIILLGSDVQPPMAKQSNVDFVLITEILNEQAKDESAGWKSGTAVGPSATNLAYVMFTSGSTGQPKGVMVEHRGIVRLVRDNNLVQHLPASRVMAHMANLAFDGSTWEIYACLLNGGTLVCIDAMAVLDPEALGRTFRQHHVQTAFMTTTLFRSHALGSPAVLNTLAMICVGGEPLHQKDFVAIQSLVSSKIINGYGPTENTTFSTSFILQKEEHLPNGVPIGRALSNSGAHVMDPELRLVPLGVIGELVVTGDGLARGYTDPQRDINRFVSVTVAGQTVRAYRTGDYVRHRPTDGLLEFFCRMDGQIKVRGNRVELGEIENVLRSHGSVSDAVTVLQQHDDDEVQLTGFVTIHEGDGLADEQAGAGPESQHVDTWEEQFDAEIYSPIHNVRPETIGRDFIGWTSMYDGTDIDKAEMNEWLDDTIATLLNGREPGHVLEIGSGTGMVLFNLGKGLQSYVGLEPSQKAVDFIMATAKSMPALAGKVQMYKATAADVGQLERPITANLVVMNSVVQYFPSQDYLFKLIQDLLALEGVRTLFFGDIRSYALYREFLATRALRMAGNKVAKADILRMMADMERVERELLVDPAFFTALPSRLPGLVEHVEILPKKMKATNELSCYRYAVVVHVRTGGQPEHDIHHIEQNRWINFAERKLGRQSLVEQLHSSSTSPLIAVSNIPHSKTSISRCLVALLDDTTSETTAQQDWLSSVYKEAKHVPALSATDLVDLAEEAGYQVEISWSRQHSRNGSLDAVFHRYQPQHGGKRVMFRFPRDDVGRPLQSLSSRPLRHQFLKKTQQQLQEMLEAQLPTYMVPQSITVLKAMPINQNGKVDRKTLAQRRENRTSHQGPLQQPTLEVEKKMQQLWARALHIDPQSIGLVDSFFRLGGDSIMAMKLVGEARRIGIHLSVADIFRHPQLDQLSSAVIASTHNPLTAIPHIDHAGPVDQSFAQRRLWFLEELHSGLTWYLMPLAVRLKGPLKLEALNTAIHAIETRHETLRTTFATDGGASVQIVQPFCAKELSVIEILPGDEQGLADAVQQDQTTSFDLCTEPGWRVSIYRVNKNDHLLSIVMHHIVSDGWSVDVLMRELAVFYSAALRSQDPLSQVQPLPIQYRDFSVWQRQQAQADEHQKQLSYWLAQLQGSRPAELMCDKPRPATLSGKADIRTLDISGRLYAELQDFCNAHEVTLFVALLAAFRATHFRLTGQDDATIGTANANRDRWEVKDIIGFFVNMQCLRITINDESFEELVQQVHRVTVASLANQDVPFESIVSQLKQDRDLSRHPLVQLVFAVHSQQNLGQLVLEGVETEGIHGAATSRFDLEFHFFQEPNGLHGNVFFSTDLYDPKTIANMLSLFHSTLQGCLRDPQAVVASLPLLTNSDFAKLDAMGLVRVEQTNYPRESSVVNLFCQQVSTHPSRVAVTDASAEMSYAELDRASGLLARWLVRRSLPPESLVGMLANRSCEAIVAFLGILKANLAYLPFDVKTPGKRMEAVLSSFPGQRVILLGSDVQPPEVKLSNVEFVRITEVLNEQANDESAGCKSDTAVGPSATSLAYVMFTSGSTGQPKGVMVEHRGIVRLVRDNNLVQHLPASRVMAHMTNLAFDVSTWEIYACLLNGGTLVCIDAMAVLDPQVMVQIFTQRAIRMAVFTPSLFRQLTLESSAIFTALEMLCVGGEAMYPQDYFAAESILTGKIINCYGPTENTGISATFVLHKKEQFTNGVPIGRALSNSGAYVMDPKLQLVPLGVIGELVVTGDGLARGYTDPQRDIDRFVTVTIAGQTVRAYRTGDYVRHRPTDGLLEFFGRIDGQIKIRGHRVELGEIEHVLRSHGSVSDAVAVLQQYVDDEVRLTGFVTIHERDALVDEQGSSSPESQHVDAWEEQFDAEIYSPIGNVRPETIGRDFIGWTSMYDGTDIDKAEMNEWLDDTIAMLLNGREPGHVLEIGSGTGMVLFNLGKGLQSYVGLEPSQKAVDFIMATAKSIPALAGRVHMYKATAADVSQLERPIIASLVVLNSVVQYFPSQDYLFKLIQDLLALEGVRTLFFGDIRSYALYREFLATRALRMAGDKVAKGDILRMMADMERVERELLVDPAFFTALPSRLPGLVEHVEILPKKMKATNELSCYRYAVVVHARTRGQPDHYIHQIEQDRWINFAERKLDPKSLLEQLHSSSLSPLMAVSNIPHSKTILSRCLVASLDDAASETTAQQDWLSSVYKEAKHVPALSATDLVDLAEEAGYQVEISWSRQYSWKGGLDAVFHRYQPQNGGKRVMFRFPSDEVDRPLHSLSSRPLRHQFLQKTQQQLHEMLEAQLPTYMVPQSITVLEAMPINQNGKVDRKMLAQQRQKVTFNQGIMPLQKLSTAQTRMQQLWAHGLGIEPERIGLNDSFFRLGGDSIAAMKLVGEARKMGMRLSVADIFRNPTLTDLAGLDYSHSGTSTEDILPFSLLGEEVDVAAAREEAAVTCGVDTSLVEDLYPCSPLQEGLVSLTSKRAGDYIMQGVLELRAEIDEEAFRAAWENVFRSMAVLRTRIVQNSNLGLLQAVIAEDIPWLEAEGLEEYLEKDKSVSMGLGDPLTRYAIITEAKEAKRWVVWTVHHALYDGWSLPHIIDVVTKAYTEGVVEQRPGFHAFIKYLNQHDEEVTAMYWKNALYDCQATLFPPLPSAVQQPVADAMIDYQCPPLPKAPSDTTTSALVRAAWAIITSRYTNSDDVVFGTTVTGRNAPVAGIEAIIGPTIATVPVRVRVAGDQTISAFLHRLQQQATDMIPYEQTGLQRIAKISAGARLACGFQTLLVVQPTSDAPGNNRVLGEWRGRSELQDFSTYGLMLQCTLSADGICITASFDRQVIEEWLVKKILSQFSFIMQQLARAQPDEKVADMDPLTPEERTELWAWNREMPAAVERCIHDLFAEQVREQPDAPAICSWDGEMTYGELDALSTRLASHLVGLGVKPEDIVPLCFEKSMWTVVAMLAVLKAGGAFLLLDLSLPHERLKVMCSRVYSTLALASAAAVPVVESLVRAVMIVNENSIVHVAQHASRTAVVQPTDTAYVIFTSGSTGEPKGCRIEHRSACSAVVGHGRHVGMHHRTRTLQFGSYSFAGSLAEILLSLTHGGCVCIPTDEERTSNLASAISRMGINWAFLTSTVLDLLSPKAVPSLTTVCVGGEPIRISQIAQWEAWVYLRQTYGSSETSGFVSSMRLNSTSSTKDVGRATTGVYWIVDPNDHSKLAPIGAIGEVLIEGAVLGREYINEPDKTAATFIKAPAWRGSFPANVSPLRLYKTGDLARYKHDGSIELLGRKDNQVKLRGQRIELGEIEHQAQLASTDVKQIAVELIHPQEEEGGILACFIVVDSRTDPPAHEDEEHATPRPYTQNVIQAIQARLEQWLPQYMVPSVFIPVPSLPATSSRKIDRKRLREIGALFSAQQLVEMRALSQGPKRLPSTQTEQTMQQLWGQALHIEPQSIGLDDSFFRLGGDSIAAMKLVGEARRIGMHLSVADIFRNPRLDQLASAATASTHNSHTAIPHIDHVSPVEPSFAQGRLWFLEQLYPGLNWYLVPFAVRIRGPLQLTALNTAVHAIESRHETLRTTFATDGGVSVQIVQPFCAKELNVIDILSGDKQGLADAVQKDQTTPFDLHTEPGWRVSVYRVNEDDHALSIVMHHIVSDGWSVAVLMRELAAFYSAALRSQDPLSQFQPLPIQYRDFSVWQRQQVQVDEHQRQLSYWLTRLQGSRPAELICDKPRPATLSGKADIRTLDISGRLYAELQGFCNAHGVTLFVVLLSAFRATHFRLTGQDDATIGTANANRDRWEVKDIIGFFVNMQCLRITVNDESFEELVQQVHEMAVASLANQDVPFESIVSQLKQDRDLSRHPLVQLVFAVHSQQNLGQLVLEGLDTEGMHGAATSRFDLEFHFYPQTNGLQGNVVFSTDLYAPETIDNMLSLFHSVLQGCLRDPKAEVASLPLLTDSDFAKLDAMGLVRVEQTNYPRESSVIDLFRQQVSAYPSRVAVTDASAEMSYAELDRGSDLVARWLVHRSFPPESLVGVLTSRSCQTIAAFLGILKANLAYLPFDVKIPGKRMEAILSSLPGQRVILLGSDVQPPEVKVKNVEFVRISEVLNEQANDESSECKSATMFGPSANSLAYVMFTSGSTGQPKGVMIEHRGIVRLVRDNNLVQHLPASRVMAHVTNLAFDVSTWEIYACLLNGGTLVCIDAMAVLDPQAMVQIFNQRAIRMAVFTPTLFRQFTLESPAIFTSVQMLCVGGEAMYPRDYFAAETILTGKLINCYGPTENTGISATFVLQKKEQFSNGVPIGRALSNSGAYVMDPKLQLVPLGVIGELIVTGDGLARGYTEPQRDINRFVTVTVAGETVRAYRTGDYVRHRPTDGLLEFFGRMDGQIKIRGNRVELGEIEHALRSHGSVSDAVTVLQQDDDDEVQLTGFVTIHEDDALAGETGAAPESQHVEAWEEQFDVDVYSSIYNVRPGTTGRDFIGWTSMYDGTDIDKVEMNEWLDDTIATLLNGQEPGHVLEIGSGTGMVLFNLGKGLQSYVGLEPSQKAVDFIMATVKSMPALAGRVHMYKATAADVSQLERPITANLVVLNSVVQYFPSQDYLFKLIQDLLALEGVRTLFFGDIRSHALYREFLATRALRMAGDKAAKVDILRMMADMERVERELLVDPAFFTALPSRLPGVVEYVEILPKKMKATNELSCYRYAVAVHIRTRGQPEHGIHYVEQDRWVDFAERKLDRRSLLEHLHSSSTSPLIAVSNIPHSKTIASRCLIASLNDAALETTAQQDWLSSVYKEAQLVPALSATDLVDIAKEAGYQVEISWSRQHSQKGGLDAVFHRYQPQDGGKRVMFRFPSDDVDRPLQSLSSRPLRHQFLQTTQQQLHEMLEAQLPAYMVPQSITVLRAMPINQNGKVDRKMLAQRRGKETFNRGIVRQQELSTVQSTLQQLWGRVLGIEAQTIGLNDSFFRLGGDSIVAMKLVGEARRMGMHLSVAHIFRHPQLDQLASAVIASTQNSLTTIPHVDQVAPVKQSFAQGRLWFLEELHPGLTWYLMPLALRLTGPLQLTALNAAIHAIESRHETLRTTFATDGGVSMQIVQPFRAKELNVIDVLPGNEQHLTDAVQQDQTTPFDLRTEPGWRVSVYRVHKNDHLLSIVMHHIVSDGWSVDVLMRELAVFYSAALRSQDPLSQVQPLPIQYRDFSVWQRQQAQVDEHQRQLSYWLTQLQESRPAELLCDKPRPSTLSGKADIRTVEISGRLYAELQQFCEAHEVTLFVALLAAFRATHFRLTGQDDATIGTANANRDRWEVKDIIGFFVNMQCLRITINDESFEELVQQVHAVTVASLANQDVPFESIVSQLKQDRDLSRHPLVQVVFAVHSQRNLGQLMLEGVETEGMHSAATSRFDLEFHFYPQTNGLQGNVVFSTDLYAPETIDNMLSLFHSVLQGCLGDPKAVVASLPLLTNSDFAKLDAMGLVQVEQTNYPRESSVVDLFRQQVSAYPSRTAVIDASAEMSYAELDRASDLLARWLVHRSFPPESLVGLLASRSCQTITAFLGILKANLAYLPFDVKIPGKRMEVILSSLPGQRIILLGSDVQPPEVKLSNVEFVRIGEVLNEQANDESSGCNSATMVGPSATSLAYVMFTSGSTGQPKGVMVEHRGIVRLVRDNNLVQYLPGSRVMAHMTNLAFDVSTWEIYASLLNGGTLVCIDAMVVLDLEAMVQIFSQHAIRMAVLTPALFRQYTLESSTIFVAVEMLCVGGEALYPRDYVAAESLLKGKLINCYGPTENTTFSTLFVLHKAEQFTNGVPIGRALSNSGAYVMDPELRLVPLGVMGELVATGDGLARGYTDPQHNINRFVTVTVAGQTVRAYRTGDYVRHRPTDGLLEFFGRMDGQIKIRGNRVELGEVEHVLRSHRSVSDAATVLQQHDGDEVQLTGFVTIHEGDALVDEQAGTGSESRHVDTWEEQFDAEIYSPIHKVRHEIIGRDFIGWTSMYDGTDIDKAEMNEWLDDTIATLLNGQEPGHVLEIGSGTGMVLFNVCKGLQSYVGLEPSQKAVDFITATVKSMPALAGRVHMYKATAADIGQLERPIAANLVVMNSVVQYFPSQDYLFKLIQDLLTLKGVRTLFFGDIRSYALYREFLATRALRMAGGKAAKADILRMMADMERVERELLVDPAFFTALPSRLPGLVEHVEIMPKKMKVTNELSCYRYAVVVHVRTRGQPEHDIHHIEQDRWIDFVERKLDRQSLLEHLHSSSTSPLIAVSNIPHSKTIVSRCLVDSLDNAATETTAQLDWLSSVYKEAKHVPALSATDLVDLAEEAGYQVEISWSRQYSWKGGLDAVFHRYQPHDGGKRVMFRFPSDDVGRPLQSLSSRPLRHQFLQKTQQQLYDMLEAQLPAYMVPQTISILEAMPVNQNGKVDRKILARRRQKMTSNRGIVQQPTSKAEKTMQQLWARVLNIDPQSIGLDDSFFHLGGDSIAAMKLVGEAGHQGIRLTIADVFRQPSLNHLVRVCRASTKLVQSILPFSLLSPETKEQILSSPEFSNTGIQRDNLVDILPATCAQQNFITQGIQNPRVAFNYLFLDIGPQLDVNLLKDSCRKLADHFPILRTRFAHARGQLWQLVIRDVGSLFTTFNVIGSLSEESHAIFLRGLEHCDPLGLPTSFILVRNKSQENRFILRLSHAQYDGVCLPIILRTLVSIYQQQPLPPTISFPTYLAHARDQRTTSGRYWRELLRNSSHTRATAKLLPKAPEDATPRLVRVGKSIFAPRLPEHLTIASLVSSAWALVLSNITGEDDIIYGHVVAGRNADIPGVTEIVGPCLNIVPVRAFTPHTRTSQELIHSIQEQHISLGQSDSMGWDEIMKECTDWPAESALDSVIQHQNIDVEFETRIAGETAKVQWFNNPFGVPSYLSVWSQPQGDKLKIMVAGNTHILAAEMAHPLLDMLVETITTLSTNLQSPLASCKSFLPAFKSKDQ
ncbi:acetyl-CoA synthetase-like protein [Lindgomyces ingoldianus]|uniref:Acetyl-CoA synthetase-like protein n=1 Tax=Lindgomyces ingoldianus TaxID=673940 RepID=A0ACB6Q9H2_9PLEO|nr:acetyl-CoA synthetase-like protein [Lindgomyces ingoldianus]KAF2463679.1 acetyl-CoA synthetase-like protein [Lindgomyces ingoldianus]